MGTQGKVLMIYTGGTIGMVPKEPLNKLSPLVPADWATLKMFNPILSDLPLEVDLHEMNLIDSSDMNPEYWIKIAKVIGGHYDDYEGFVILHGTDTMTYTASALSFLLENLDKPVVLTGSQISICQPRNDAVQNLVTSLQIAAPGTFGLHPVPEVCIYFNNTLLRGNRARKVSSSGFAGFESPNFEPLAIAGEHVQFNKKLIREPSSRGFFINETLEQNVVIFDVFPGIRTEILKSIFEIPKLKGVILRTFGAGNAPTDTDFLKEIEHAATKKNLAIVNITQCNQGMVEMGLYAASVDLLRLGVISGVDMTPEAALTKMEFLLGIYGDDIDTVKDMMQRDLRGEQTVSVFNLIYDRCKTDPVLCRMPAKQVGSGVDTKSIETANIRFDGVEVDSGSGEIELAVFMNYPAADESADTNIPQCLGVLSGSTAEGKTHLILDSTEKVKQLLNPDRPVQLTVVSKNGNTVRWDSAVLSIYTSS